LNLNPVHIVPIRIKKWFSRIKIPPLGNESGILLLLYAENLVFS